MKAILRDQGKLDALDYVLRECKDEATRARYLNALCDAWLGPKQLRFERSDRGGWHEKRRGYFWVFNCLVCEREYEAYRIDAAFCSGRCRQKAYRWAKAAREQAEGVA